MSRPRVLLALACLPGVLLVTACSSGSSAPKPTPTQFPIQSFQLEGTRAARLTPLFVQCLAQHNIPIRDSSLGDMNVASVGEREGWYKNARVSDNAAFSDFLTIADGALPEGPLYSSLKQAQPPVGIVVTHGNFVLGEVGSLSWWVGEGAVYGKWPAICGTLPEV
jgi:hypothetical protein